MAGKWMWPVISRSLTHAWNNALHVDFSESCRFSVVWPRPIEFSVRSGTPALPALRTSMLSFQVSWTPGQHKRKAAMKSLCSPNFPEQPVHVCFPDTACLSIIAVTFFLFTNLNSVCRASFSPHSSLLLFFLAQSQADKTYWILSKWKRTACFFCITHHILVSSYPGYGLHTYHFSVSH